MYDKEVKCLWLKYEILQTIKGKKTYNGACLEEMIFSLVLYSFALAWPILSKMVQGAQILHFSEAKFTYKNGGLLGPFDSFNNALI